MNLLDRGIRHHARHMPRAAGRTVRYFQGGKLIQLTGWVAMKEYEATGEDGFLTLVTSFDWCFETSDLGITPIPGDEIEETIGGVKTTYMVSPAGSKPAHEWLDTSGLMIRVRSKKLG